MIGHEKVFTVWIGQTWNRFWFAPCGGRQSTRIRVLTCSLATFWFIIQMTNSQWYFGEVGWIKGDIALPLSVATEGMWPARFRLSPLWYASEPMAIKGWISVGIALSVLSAIGFGGRWSLLALWIFVLGLAQRLTWTTGAFEPFLISVLGYLIIGPGYSFLREPTKPSENNWTSTLSTRMIQVHLWILLAFGLASQLSVQAWWRGDAVWWLAVSQHSNLLTAEWLRGRLILINALTHAILLASLLSVTTLWHRRLRPIGVGATYLVAIAYGLIGDQLMYGLLLSVAVTSFCKQPDRNCP